MAVTLKLPPELKERVASVVKGTDKSPHAFMVEAIEQGFPQREIAEASYKFQQAVERREKIIVGVNEFVTEEAKPVDVLVIDDDASRRQCENLRRLREVKRAYDPTNFFHVNHNITPASTSAALAGSLRRS